LTKRQLGVARAPEPAGVRDDRDATQASQQRQRGGLDAMLRHQAEYDRVIHLDGLKQPLGFRIRKKIARPFREDHLLVAPKRLDRDIHRVVAVKDDPPRHQGERNLLLAAGVIHAVGRHALAVLARPA
jgi:hypothetical protein